MAICQGCNKEWEPSRNSKGLYCSTKCQQKVSIDERRLYAETKETHRVC